MNRYWQAIAHLLISGKDGKPVDVSHDERAEGGQYVFVASSRVAAGMSDKDLTRGGLVLPSVVGGGQLYVNSMLRRFGNVLSATPELAVPRPIHKVSIPVGVATWASEKHPNSDVVWLVERLGIASPTESESSKLSIDASFHEKVSRIERSSDSQEEAQSALSALLDGMFDDWNNKHRHKDALAVDDRIDVATWQQWK